MRQLFFIHSGLRPLTRCSLLAMMICIACQSPDAQQQSQVVDSVYVDQVWSAHPVDFALLTAPPHQFVAYYDSSRVMTVAQRKLNQKSWTRVKLDETTGWDSHNYISMALDQQGHLHVSGNMHNDSLVYFQAERPYDVQSLVRRKTLTGKQEVNVTYPEFLQLPTGHLIFSYRVGGSGNGIQIYNRYDPETRTWMQLHDQPLVDGQGAMNAYLHGPVAGPDGFFHMTWVWRNTPDAATNHDLSYAKTKDLVNWQKSDGTPQELPITFENCEIVDPVAVGQGMINGNTVIGFDQQNRCIISYHKFDAAGNTQVYQARLEDENWQIYQSTDYDFRWEFGGWGSLNSRIKLSPVQSEQQQLSQYIWIDTAGVQNYQLHPENLSVVEKQPPSDAIPAFLSQPVIQGRQVNLLENTTDNGRYVLRWETLPRNRDLPIEEAIPGPTALVLYQLAKQKYPLP